MCPHLVDADGVGNPLGGRGIVAGEHHQSRDSVGAQPADDVRGARSGLVGEAQRPSVLAVHRHLNGRARVLFLDLGARDAMFVHERIVSHHDFAGINQASDASPLNGLKVLHLRNLQSASTCRFHDCHGEGMPRPQISGGRVPEDVIFRERGVVNDDAHHFRHSHGEGAGLVEHDGVDLGQPFQVQAAFDQDPVAGRAGNRRDHHHRRGQTEFGRRREDQKRDDLPDVAGHHEHDDQEDEHERQQPHGNSISQLLHRRCFTARVLDEGDDAREQRVGADSVGPDVERSGFHQGPRKD